jgi:hypothetical protein
MDQPVIVCEDNVTSYQFANLADRFPRFVNNDGQSPLIRTPNSITFVLRSGRPDDDPVKHRAASRWNRWFLPRRCLDDSSPPLTQAIGPRSKMYGHDISARPLSREFPDAVVNEHETVSPGGAHSSAQTEHRVEHGAGCVERTISMIAIGFATARPRPKKRARSVSY